MKASTATRANEIVNGIGPMIIVVEIGTHGAMKASTATRLTGVLSGVRRSGLMRKITQTDYWIRVGRQVSSMTRQTRARILPRTRALAPGVSCTQLTRLPSASLTTRNSGDGTGMLT